MRIIVLSTLVAVALVACRTDDTIGDWRDSADRTLASYPGPDHCDWESVTFLEVGLDLTRPEARIRSRSQYLRDPDGLLAAYSVGTYDGDASLPGDAIDTGFRSGDAELWVSPADADGGRYDAVYVVDDGVERWPRTREEIACA